MANELPYLRDIREQPAVLDRVLAGGVPPEVAALLLRLRTFDRIVMTGMGASLYGQYPAYLRLVDAGLPVWLVESAELLGDAGGLLTPGTLLWITSQSGDSGEVRALLDRPRPSGLVVFGVTNATDGHLARKSDVVLPLRSGDEHAVGTKSYVATLLTHELAAASALDELPPAGLAQLPELLDAYLSDLEAHVEELDQLVPERTRFVLGRGRSLAAARTGALIVKEAAKVPIEGLSAPQFRHGPLELVEPGVAVLVLAGGADTEALSRATLDDVRRLGGNGVWLGTEDDPPGHRLPDLGAGAAALPIAEIVALQMLSIALARRRGVEPGAFRHIGKVTQVL